MATIFTHPIVAISLSPWLRHSEKHWVILITGMILTILPDIDVIGFKLGIPYLHLFGHRGFTHSIFFAALMSGVVAWILVYHSQLKLTLIWFYLFICMMSHGLLDAFTNGGHGIAFFSPFSNERFFFPFQPIEVSTLSIKRFFAGQGYDVIISELIWLWLPLTGLFITGLIYRWSRERFKLKQIKVKL